ncbi:MAG: hypothetical protein K0S09_2017 [Sphingobacteriaceae bacterium]|jgi:hypothetical protein|nr:hypothetical protein [Sphingobacteriaceae bacterium]
MKLFISWSGELSHRIALALMDWFPYVINQVVPFVSSESIRKGERWGLDIHSELSKSRFCLVCLTRENLSEPWIMFEAGAISGSTGRSRVCAILFDGLRQKDIGAPLSLFQNSGFERDEFRKLLLSVNDSFGKKKISEAVLLKSFET